MSGAFRDKVGKVWQAVNRFKNSTAPQLVAGMGTVEYGLWSQSKQSGRQGPPPSGQNGDSKPKRPSGTGSPNQPFPLHPPGHPLAGGPSRQNPQQLPGQFPFPGGFPLDMGNPIQSQPKKPSSSKGSKAEGKKWKKGKSGYSSGAQYLYPTPGLAAAMGAPPNGSSNVGKKKTSGSAKASGSSKKAPGSKKKPTGSRTEAARSIQPVGRRKIRVRISDRTSGEPGLPDISKRCFQRVGNLIDY